MCEKREREAESKMARPTAVVLVTLVLAPTMAAQEPSLRTLRLPGGTRVVGNGAGEMLTWQPGGTVTRWDTSGRRLGEFSADGLSPQDGAPFVARRDRALLCAPTGGGIHCRIVETASGRRLASFTWEEHPVRAWPADEGWLLATAPTAGLPEVRRWADDGSFTALALPQERLAALARRLDVQVAAIAPRLFAAAGELWAIPAGAYEFWRLAPAPLRQHDVPPCRRVEGHHYQGEEATRRRGEFFSCDGGGREALFDPAAEMERMRRAMGLPAAGQRPPAHHAFIAAIGRVAVSGRRLAVRVDDGREGSGARVDVWEVGNPPRLVAEAALPPGGWNPVEVSAGHVWVACREQLQRLPLRPLGGGDPCAGGGDWPTEERRGSPGRGKGGEP